MKQTWSCSFPIELNVAREENLQLRVYTVLYIMPFKLGLYIKVMPNVRGWPIKDSLLQKKNVPSEEL